MNKVFQIPAVLEGVTPLKDGGVSLRWHTQEVTRDQKVELMEFYQDFGWLLFSAEQQDESKLKLEAVRKDTGGKSPSQRLRSVLYVLYQAEGDTSTTFEVYYERKMEKFIGWVKQNLDGTKL